MLVYLQIYWLIECTGENWSFSVLRLYCSWQVIKQWLSNLLKTLLRRFRWGFVLAGCTALTMAAISWKLESSASYWIWHRYIIKLSELPIKSQSLNPLSHWYLFLCDRLQHLACCHIYIFLFLPLFESKHGNHWESSSPGWNIWISSAGFFF